MQYTTLREGTRLRVVKDIYLFSKKILLLHNVKRKMLALSEEGCSFPPDEISGIKHGSSSLQGDLKHLLSMLAPAKCQKFLLV